MQTFVVVYSSISSSQDHQAYLIVSAQNDFVTVISTVVH